jgi:transposase
LHQLYRAMAWLGEALTDQSGATRASRRTKDLIEEALFERRRNLFSDLSVVLFDTTSLMFTGGGESLGQFGVSKDHRPELHQVVVSVVLDEAGRPICSETWPGNATDVKSLLPVVTRLRDRFGIRHMCVVADRGMISTETIAELEARGIDYILGARERSSSEIREVVLTDRADGAADHSARAGLRTRHRGQGGDRRRLGAGGKVASLRDLFQSRRGTP